MLLLEEVETERNRATKRINALGETIVGGGKRCRRKTLDGI